MSLLINNKKILGTEPNITPGNLGLFAGSDDMWYVKKDNGESYPLSITGMSFSNGVLYLSSGNMTFTSSISFGDGLSIPYFGEILVDNIGTNGCRLSCDVTNVDVNTLLIKRFCISDSPNNPNLSSTLPGSLSGVFNAGVTGSNTLQVQLPYSGSLAQGSSTIGVSVPFFRPNTQYWVRLAIQTENGINFYSSQYSFTTAPVNTISPSGGLLAYDKGFYSDNGSGTNWRYLEIAPTDETPTNIGFIGFTLLDPMDPNSASNIYYDYIGLNQPQSRTTTAFGYGLRNTNLIVASYSSPNFGLPDHAAKVCSDKVLNGYSDWFLPSQNELSLIWRNMVLYGLNVAGFATQSTPLITGGVEQTPTNNNVYASSYEISLTSTQALSFGQTQSISSNANKSFFLDVDGDLNTLGDITIQDSEAGPGLLKYRFRSARYF